MINLFKIKSTLNIVSFLVYLISQINCQIVDGTFHPDPDPNVSQNAEDKPATQVHYAYSPLHLTFLAKIEKQIYEMMGQYEHELLERLDIIRRFRWDYEDSVSNALTSLNPEASADEWQRASFLISHPSLTIRMLRRYSVELKNFYSNMWKNHETDIWNKLENWRGENEWPTVNDVRDSFQQLLRIQDTYDINPEQFAIGVVKGHLTKVGLTARHCLEITEYALNSGDSLSAGEWIKAARHKIAIEGDQSVSVELLAEYWAKVERMYGKTWNIDDFNVQDIFHEAKSVLRRTYEEEKFNRTFENRFNNYKALCRGEKLMSPSKMSKVYCYLDTKKDPYFTINPLKIEIHNLKPEIIEIHGIFGERLAPEISMRSLQPLMRSYEHNQPRESGFLNFKTTSPAWVSPTEYLVHVLKSIEKALGIQVLGPQDVAGEPFVHVSAFAVGGHYYPCLECEGTLNEEFKQYFGSRMATIQFALEEPETGGEVVFTRLGVTIKPRKGSVLVFYNLLSNGNIDPMSLHGSCPVVLGHKWVASKFVYENANFLKRKCSTNKNN